MNRVIFTEISLIVLILFSTIFTTRYTGLVLIFLIYFHKFNHQTKYRFKNIILFSTFLLYLKLFILSLSSKFNSNWIASLGLNNEIRFGDLQLTLTQLKCNFFGSTIQNFYKVNFSDLYLDCPYNAGYGPLLRLFKFDLDIWSTTLFLAIIFSIIFIYAVNFSSSNKIDFLIYTCFLISPPVFLIFSRMNIDILIIPFIYIVLIKYGTDSYLTTLTLLFTSLLKIYPLLLILIILIYKLINKKFSFIPIYFFAASLSSYLIIFDNNFIQTSPIRPSQSNIAHGLLTNSQELWIKLLDRFGGYRYVLVIYFLLFSLILLTIFSIKKYKNYKISLAENELVLILFFLSIFLYANYDQRIIILFFACIPIFKSNYHNIKKLCLVVLFLSPLPEFGNIVILNILTLLKVSVTYYLVAILISVSYQNLVEIFHRE